LDKINREQVAYVAHLARLSFSGEETEKFTSQLNDILLYMDKLNEADTTEDGARVKSTLKSNTGS